MSKTKKTVLYCIGYVKAAKVPKKDFIALFNYIFKNYSYLIVYLSVVQESYLSIDK